ncbi:MAG: HAD-IIIC family phosphatase [Gemmatimonadota bacterium]|nr:hypothetical protein [Gemmatimonadota bacterium]MDP6461127.1 HAD-IIIC family phosphatase [Gemmatimonadota bacterium]MDP6529821.1 HAD-IIIC family phosphatase [Gemmatimonadota bacterium]MDP6802764.1 HAD-IIIC family phosphatase [Gemmatimonadota bacterium]MDP7032112.1 HAD-IIIC family phosphatase [Gemmatimonadota bacterium]
MSSQDEIARGDALRDAGDVPGAFAAWAVAAAANPDSTRVWKLEKRFRALPPTAPGEDRGVPVRVALLGDATMDYTRAFAEVVWRAHGFDPAFYNAPFGQYAQEILSADSGLHAFAPHLTLLVVHGETLALEDPADEGVPGAFTEFVGLCRRLASEGEGIVLVHDFLVPEDAEEGMAKRVVSMNDALGAAAEEERALFVFPMDAFAKRVGKARLRDPRLWERGRIPVAEEHHAALVREYLRTVKPLTGRNRKCLVLDLDNTLWGGIVGERGARGVDLGPGAAGAPFAAFQRAVLRLFERGVILAVSSRNNEADAMEVLERHEHQLLRPDHFAAMRIDWRDKVEHLRELASEIGIGLDSLVFLDDNPVERGNVRHRLPEVLVPELPRDPSEYARFLGALTDFDTLSLTDEDRARGRMVAADKKRRKARSKTADLEEYLMTLRTEVTLHRVRDGEIDRVHQLMQKTNQFNTTTLRWSLAEVESFREDPHGALHTASVTDRFGDSGLCGVCLSRSVEEKAVEITGLLLSCRVLGRGVEDAVLWCILREWKENGARIARGLFTPTDRNEPCREFFVRNGFVSAGRGEAGECFQHKMETLPEGPAWVRVIRD